MITNKDYKFTTSISREGYTDKETAKACLSYKMAKAIGKQKMAFKEQEVTVEEFLDYAINGYSFCNLFKFNQDKQYWVQSGKYWNKTYPVYRRGDNKGYFKLSFKQNKYFKGSQTIFVDIDYTHFNTIDSYVSTLTYKPTCVYTSFSDNVNKHGITSRRFRLVYVFDSIMNEEVFDNTTLNLYTQIIADTDEPMADMCGMGVSQYMNGSNSNETYVSNIIYSVEDIKDIVEVKPVSKPVDEKEVKDIVFDKELVYDMNYLPYKTVVEKWWTKGLRYITRTEKDFDAFYSTDTDDFYSLFYHANKVEDGSRRRIKLFLRAALRRLIKEDITADELLYNLYIDRERFFDNTDDALNIDVLMSKIKGALRTDISIINGFTKDFKKPTFIINKNVVNKRAAVGKARKDIKDKQIAELYDSTKSVKENLQVMKDSGMKISMARLYNWVKENGINEKKVVEYNPELSIRENMKLMGCTKYQVEKAKKCYTGNCITIEETKVEETPVENYEVFTTMDNYFDNKFEGAADFFRFYGDYESIDDSLKESLMKRFNITSTVLCQYYLQYQPWVGAKNCYGF